VQLPLGSPSSPIFSGPPLGPSKGLVREVPIVVPPWLAGLGMAGSSLVVVLNALRAAR